MGKVTERTDVKAKNQKSILHYFKKKDDNAAIETGLKRQSKSKPSLMTLKKAKTVAVLDADGDHIEILSEKLIDEVEVLSDSSVMRPPVITPVKTPTKTSCTSTPVSKGALTFDEDTTTSISSQASYASMSEFLEIDMKEALQNDVVCDAPDVNSDAIDEEIKLNEVQLDDYKLRNFRAMLDFVLQTENHKHLFNSDDWKQIEGFTSLSVPAQRLYIRLYLRKRRWVRTTKLKYPEIAADLTSCLEELRNMKLLLPGTVIDNLEEALNALELVELKMCSKTMKDIKPNQLANKTLLMEAITKHVTSNQSIASHFTGKHQSLKDVVLQQVKKVLGSTSYMINDETGQLFSRMQYLYYPPQVNEDENGQILSHEFFNALKVEAGEARYPTYTIKQEANVYRDRDDLIRYHNACSLESRVLTSIEGRKHAFVVTDLLTEAEDGFKDTFQGSYHSHDSSLPPYLRNMTAGHVYVRCVNHIYSVVETMKDYEKAVQMLEALIGQEVYCLHYRGKWYERLVLDLEAHLKQPLEAYNLIQQALKDPHVKLAFRYTLYKRGLRLFKSLQKVKKRSNPITLIDCPECDIPKCPEKTIEAPTLSKGVQGRRTVFVSIRKDGTTECLPVEQVSLLYYKQRGYVEGLHTESTVYHILFGLLFWNIIYSDELPDAFRTPHQTLPLDFVSDLFYERRKDVIEKRLTEIRGFTEEDLCFELETAWNDNVGCMSLINWESISLEHMHQIAICMGTRPIGAICERLCKNFRFARSGFPDLLVWNPMEKTAKAVEVKGPNDVLSSKQILWIDYMNEWGLEAEVCYVKAAPKGSSGNIV
ncbi:Fanconi-associated nuclease 1 [Halotydeus destructor]|nr:Fanconi-associated nuclease 1 [Halotydeus destructor]